MKYEKALKELSNSTVYKKIKWKRDARNSGKCALCPKHGCENFRVNGHKPKHGAKKPKYKNKKGQKNAINENRL